MTDVIEKTPPKLGNVEIQRVNGRGWRVQRNGATVASGLSFAQVTAIVRGEVKIDALEGRQTGND